MPVPVAALGAKGVSELIALGTLGVSAAAAASQLSDERVEISNISIGAAGIGDPHVGDRFTITASFSVSYGDIYSGGILTVELYEVGRAAPLVSETRRNRPPKEPVTLNFPATAVGTGTQFYYVRVEATGEDDGFLFFRDEARTRVQESPHLSVTVSEPITLAFTPPEQDVGHGATARAQLLGRNESPEPAYVGWFFDGFFDFRKLRGNAPTTVLETRNRAHESRHPVTINPVQYYFALNELERGVVIVPTPRGAIGYSQTPRRYPDLRVNCTRTADLEDRVGQLREPVLPRLDESRVKTRRRAIQFACVDETGDPAACIGVIQDAVGTVKTFRSSAGGRVSTTATLAGPFVRLGLTPRDETLRPQDVMLTDDVLDEGITQVEFAFAPGPDVTGRVLVDGDGAPVAGVRVRLVGADEQTIVGTTTDEAGRFRLPTRRRDFTAPLRVVATLPSTATYAWRRPVIEYPLSVEELRENPVVLLRPRARAPSDVVTLSGRVVARDGLTGEIRPVSTVDLLLLDPDTLEEVARGTSDARGRYALSAPAGVYVARRAPAPERGFGAPPDTRLTLRTRRTGLDVRLSRRPPNVTAIRDGSILGTTGLSVEGAEVLALQNGRVLTRAPAGVDGCFTLTLPGRRKKNLRLATSFDGLVGRPSTPFSL